MSRQEIRSLKKKEPTPQNLTLLSYYYIKRGRLRKADKILVKNYLKHPDHPIVRINYADMCLRKKRHHEIPAIFKNKLTLPAGKVDVNEYRGFMLIMARFYLAENEREKAEAHFYHAYKIDPDHPSIKLLQKMLAN